jgi:hypothetical protein
MKPKENRRKKTEGMKVLILHWHRITRIVIFPSEPERRPIRLRRVVDAVATQLVCMKDHPRRQNHAND